MKERLGGDQTGSFCVSLISSRPIQLPHPPTPTPTAFNGRRGRGHPSPAQELRHQVAAAGRPKHRATHTDGGHTDRGRRQARREGGRGGDQAAAGLPQALGLS